MVLIAELIHDGIKARRDGAAKARNELTRRLEQFDGRLTTMHDQLVGVEAIISARLGLGASFEEKQSP